MLTTEELLLIIYFIAVSILLVSFVIVFFIAFQKRKNKLLLEQIEAEKKYQKELVNSKMEIQEQTLKHVGRELHDNIGQLLSVANMQLNILENAIPEESRLQFGNLREVLRNSIQEVRGLSKSLNSEVLNYLGLEKTVENELNRLNRMTYINFVFEKEGTAVTIDFQDSIIIFRILQEFLNNVIKHSQAKNLLVKFEYLQKFLIIEMTDDGVGFNKEEVNGSNGLINMASRAKLLQAKLVINSEIEKGTQLKLEYPLKKTLWTEA